MTNYTKSGLKINKTEVIRESTCCVDLFVLTPVTQRCHELSEHTVIIIEDYTVEL